MNVHDIYNVIKISYIYSRKKYSQSISERKLFFCSNCREYYDMPSFDAAFRNSSRSFNGFAGRAVYRFGTCVGKFAVLPRID